MIDDADVVLFEVEHHAFDAVRELDEFRRLRRVQAVDARDVVADFDDGADFRLRWRPVLNVAMRCLMIPAISSALIMVVFL